MTNIAQCLNIISLYAFQHYREKSEDLKRQREVDFKKWAKSLSADERVLFSRKGHKYLTNAQRSALSDAPITARQAFMRKAFAAIKGKNRGNIAAHRELFSETVKEASRKWRALSESQRQVCFVPKLLNQI